jgi:hypothetical protein
MGYMYCQNAFLAIFALFHWPDVHLIQIQTYGCKAKCITDITLHPARNYFPLYLVCIQHIIKKLQ